MNDDEQTSTSKTRRKNQMTALQDLGEALVALSDKELANIPIPPQLAEQIDIAKRITHNSGKRRQLQYIGKLMRSIDATPIEAAYQELLSGRKTAAREFHQLEQWRDRLIGEGQETIDAFIEMYPDTDRQQLRLLVRQSQKEWSEIEQAQQQGKPAKPVQYSRKLFRFIRQLHDAI